MKSIRLLILFAMSTWLADPSYAQHPTYSALLNLRHDVDNNQYDPDDAAPISEKNMVWTNIFFHYYKNQKFENSNGKENMILSIGYQYMVQVKITSAGQTVFAFPLKSPNDKIKSFKMVTYDPAQPKKSETRVKRKSYNTTQNDSAYQVDINIEELGEGSILKISCEIESFYFLKLTPFSTFDISNADYIFSMNQPILFIYGLPSELDLEVQDRSTGNFKLIEFTNQNPPLADYPVISFSTKYLVKDQREKDRVILTLKQMTETANIGMDIDYLMRFSKK